MVAGEHLVRGCGAGGRAEGAARTYEAVLRGSRFVRLLAGARQLLLLYENLAVTDLSDRMRRGARAALLLLPAASLSHGP